MAYSVLKSLKGPAPVTPQISAADELVATELMFNGVYNSLDAHQLVALVSCLVPSDKSEVTYRELGILQLVLKVICSGLSFLNNLVVKLI